jgi:hypothetical protein
LKPFPIFDVQVDGNECSLRDSEYFLAGYSALKPMQVSESAIMG